MGRVTQSRKKATSNIIQQSRDCIFCIYFELVRKIGGSANEYADQVTMCFEFFYTLFVLSFKIYRCYALKARNQCKKLLELG